MKRPGVMFGVRTIILIALFMVGYVLFGLLKEYEQKNLYSALNQISELRWNLVSNRLAFVGLTKLDPNRADADNEKTVFYEKLASTASEALDMTDESRELKGADLSLERRWPELIRSHKGIYVRQEQIIQLLYQQNSFDEGMAILRSEEAVRLITDETNLILEYEYWEGKIRERLGPDQ